MNRTVLGMILIFFVSCVFADWNQEFDANTAQMLTELIAAPVARYQKEYAALASVRDRYVKDTKIQRLIRDMVATDKEVIPMESDKIVIKKRRHDLLDEAFAWEIATLMGSHSCVVPSLAVEIGGKKVILQKMEQFSIREKNTKFPKMSVLCKVSLDSYWKGLLQAYLLGMGDLVGRNIGINHKGKIRFFDIESSFHYHNQPQGHGYYFHSGFIAQAFAWPQFEQPITSAVVMSLCDYVRSLEHLEENLKIYQKYRPFTKNIEGMLERLSIIRNFFMEEGRSFCDFYSFAFPSIGKGLQELQDIVKEVFERPVTSGEAIIFARKGMKKYPLSDRSKQRMSTWIATYIE